MDTFNFKSEILNIQNNLIANSISKTANIDILNSEEAIKSVMQSYMSKFKSSSIALVDAAQLVINSREVIKKEQFEELFTKIYIDLASIYKEIELADNVINANLQRNKNYFTLIKKRIKDLWLKLYNISGTEDYINATKTIFESFSTDLNAETIENFDIDSKFGYMHLTNSKKEYKNKSYLIKNITSTVYPIHNIDDGTIHTTSKLNTYEYNYSDGTKDMLSNGLWKAEVLTNVYPEYYLSITDTYGKKFSGVTAIIDIEFSKKIKFNRLDLDIFGEFNTIIDSIFYKTKVGRNWVWKAVKLINGDNINASFFDSISFRNIQTVTTSNIKLILNQKHYKNIESNMVNEYDLINKINNDLSEKRLEIIDIGNNNPEGASVPLNSNNNELYFQITNILEKYTDVQIIINKIDQVLNPQSDLYEIDFQNTLKFEIGAWSINPIYEEYNIGLASYISNTYEFIDQPLTSVDLNSNKIVPSGVALNWNLIYNNFKIPIIDTDIVNTTNSIDKTCEIVEKLTLINHNNTVKFMTDELSSQLTNPTWGMNNCLVFYDDVYNIYDIVGMGIQFEDIIGVRNNNYITTQGKCKLKVTNKTGNTISSGNISYDIHRHLTEYSIGAIYPSGTSNLEYLGTYSGKLSSDWGNGTDKILNINLKPDMYIFDENYKYITTKFPMVGNTPINGIANKRYGNQVFISYDGLEWEQITTETYPTYENSRMLVISGEEREKLNRPNTLIKYYTDYNETCNVYTLKRVDFNLKYFDTLEFDIISSSKSYLEFFINNIYYNDIKLSDDYIVIPNIITVNEYKAAFMRNHNDNLIIRNSILGNIIYDAPISSGTSGWYKNSDIGINSGIYSNIRKQSQIIPISYMESI